MSKKSFNDIEQSIKTAAEAHNPAFDEESWRKMEALLDKDKDRRRPFFWIWWLLSLLIGAGVVTYFSIADNADAGENISTVRVVPAKDNSVPLNQSEARTAEQGDFISDVKKDTGTFATNDIAEAEKPAEQKKKASVAVVEDDIQKNNKEKYKKTKHSGSVKGKIKATIVASNAVSDLETAEDLTGSKSPVSEKNNSNTKVQEEVVLVNIDTDKADEKEIEKIIDGVVAKKENDKKSKSKAYRFYIIAAAGVEGSGVKLFSADKLTGRAGIAFGYQLNKKLSVQTGFFISNKKYIAGGSDYKIKPGSYWSTVKIESINANCRIYEIPVTIRYDFTTVRKLNLFAAAGLSSYIMKKEDYKFYYDHYGTPHQADIYYSGNKNFFSILRLAAGVEKKMSENISLFASPGVAIPLSGVGEGEVKLYSTDIIIGLKFTPNRKPGSKR